VNVSNVRSGAEVAVNEAAPVSSPASRVTILDAKTASVIDANGRTIRVKRLSALDRMRLFSACGAENSENRAFMAYAATAAAVTEIDGAPVSFPANQIQLSALVGRLDESGLEAAVTALVEMTPVEGVADAAKN
jgi:hypothetical protein